MIKYLIILINSIAVFLYSLFSADGGVTVTGTFPASIKAGQEAQVEIKITKGAMNGFAKLQMELPEGMAVKETENKGANYTYSNGIAKWVWASLPPENEITIKLKLITSEEASGIKSVNAKFSYVENNAKQVSEMTPAEITIIAAEGAVVDAVAPATSTVAASETPSVALPATETLAVTSPATETTAAVTQVPVATETPVAVKTEQEPANPPVTQVNPIANANQANSNAEPPGNISVERVVSKVSDSEFLVKLKIKKGATKGFARYSDDLPEAFTVKAIKTDGSSFSVGDGKLKFVWVTVPAKEELELEYSVSGTTNGQVAMSGEYSYLEENQSKKYKLPQENITFTGDAAIADKSKTTAQDNRITETQTAAAPETAMKESLSQKEGNINYHVQIGAFTNAKVDATRLEKVFKVTELISSEMQGGFSKFMVGTHQEYKGARDHREIMKNNNGIKSAFVVAYNGSKRITVQEALMITNQKWFK